MNQIESFSKKISGWKNEIEPDAELLSVEPMLRKIVDREEELNRPIKIILDFPKNLPLTHSEEQLYRFPNGLEMVIGHLLDNVRDYVKRDDKQVSIQVTTDEDYLYL